MDVKNAYAIAATIFAFTVMDPDIVGRVHNWGAGRTAQDLQQRAATVMKSMIMSYLREGQVQGPDGHMQDQPSTHLVSNQLFNHRISAVSTVSCTVQFSHAHVAKLILSELCTVADYGSQGKRWDGHPSPWTICRYVPSGRALPARTVLTT